MKKRATTMLLALVMALTLLPVTAPGSIRDPEKSKAAPIKTRRERFPKGKALPPPVTLDFTGQPAPSGYPPAGQNPPNPLSSALRPAS